MNDTLTILTENGLSALTSAEPRWPDALRKAGGRHYDETPLPSRVLHLWRYTDPGLFDVEGSEENLGTVSMPANGGIKGEPRSGYAGWISLEDKVLKVHLDDRYAEMGVVLASLESAGGAGSGRVRERFGKLVPPEFGKFEALNHALWNVGFFLHVPDDVVIEQPILLDRSLGAGGFLRLLVVVGENSELTLVDDFRADDEDSAHFLNGVNELFAGAGSRVRYVNLQRLSKADTLYLTHRAELEREARLTTVFLALGSAASKVDLGVELAGEGSESRLFGLLSATDEQHLDHHTVQHHTADRTLSRMDFRVALQQRSTSVYTGLIRIEEDAAECEAYQENRNLLLDDKARARSIPELEILNDQVSCSHGVTVGTLDPEMVFYLTSRGVAHKDAVRIIVEGFYEPTLMQVPEDLRDLVREILLEKMERES